MFVVGKTYTKKDIYALLNVPSESQKGSWDTGYRSYNEDIFIFTNIGTAGRTGVNHGNYWDNGNLVWYGKTTSHAQQPLVKMMISNECNVHIFFRNDSTKGFTYKGLGLATSIEGDKPIRITWSFINPINKPSHQLQPIEGIDEIYECYKEGSLIKTEISIYKRSIKARQRCIDIKGCSCCVCGFDFEKTYGAIGRGFIHIHHLNHLSERGNECDVNPEIDLVPVCPNCHSMLHNKKFDITIEELKSYLNKKDNV